MKCSLGSASKISLSWSISFPFMDGSSSYLPLGIPVPTGSLHPSLSRVHQCDCGPGHPDQLLPHLGPCDTCLWSRLHRRSLPHPLQNTRSPGSMSTCGPQLPSDLVISMRSCLKPLRKPVAWQGKIPRLSSFWLLARSHGLTLASSSNSFSEQLSQYPEQPPLQTLQETVLRNLLLAQRWVMQPNLSLIRWTSLFQVLQRLFCALPERARGLGNGRIQFSF